MIKIIGLNPASPSNATVPVGTAISFGKVDLTAGSSDAQFSSITVTRQGLGSRSDFDKVWLEKDGVRVTSRQSITTDDKAILSFYPALVVKAGSTVTLDLIARYNSTTVSGLTSSFAIVSASDIVAGGAVKGTFPLTTASMTTSGYKTLPVVLASNNSSDTDTTYTSTYKVGDKAVELAQFKITANGTGGIVDRDVSFKSISMKNEGTSKVANLSNIALYNGSTKISTETTVNGEVVSFAVAGGYKIKYGNTETFYVRADINGLDSTTFDVYKFNTKYEEDLNVVELNTWFGSRIYTNNTLGTFSAMTNGNYKVEGGKITLARSSDAPNTKTVAKGATSVSLLKSDIFVKEPVRFEWVQLALASTQAYANSYSTFKLKVGNTVVSTFTPGSTNSTLDFDTSFTIDSNTTLEVIADVKSNATYTGSLKINTLDYTALTHYGNAEYVSNGNQLTSTDLVGSVAGATVTVGTPSLTVTKNDGIQAGKVTIAGSKGIKVAGYTVKASDVDDLTIQKVKFIVAATGTQTGGSLISNAKLMINGVQAGDLTDFAGNDAEFNNLTVKVAKNQQVQLDLYVDYSTSFAASSVVYTLKANTMTVRDSSSNTLSTLPSDVASTNFVVTTGGSVKVAYNSNTPSSSIVPASLTEKEVARFTLGSTDDKVKVTDLYLINATPTTSLTNGSKYLVQSWAYLTGQLTTSYGYTGANLSTGTVAWNIVGTASGTVTVTSGYAYAIDNNLGSRVNSIALYDLAGNKLADGTINNEVVSFNMGDSSALSIAADNNDYTVVVKAKFNSITSANQSGNFVSLNAWVTPDSAVTDTVNWIRALSDSTGLSTTTVAGFAKTNSIMITKSVATVTKAADNRIPSTLTVGDQYVYAVQVTADAAGSIDLAKLTANITPSTNVTLDTTATLVDASDLRVVATASNVASTGGLVSFSMATAPETISAGTSKIYLVKVTVGGTIVTGSSIATTLSTDSSFVAKNTISGLTANFIWSDRADSAHGASTSDYYNGYKVNGLEGIASQTISK